MYLSTNKGASWTAVNTGLEPYLYINTLAVDGVYLYAGTTSGVFVSTNNGTSWSAASIGMTGRNVHAFAVRGANLFAGTWDGGVFLSTNNGTSWTAVNTGLPMLIVLSLAASPNGAGRRLDSSSGTNLFVGLDEGAGVFRSTNNGTSWTAARTGLTNGTIQSLAISGTYLFAGTDEGVFLSTNNGTSWTAANSGVPVDAHGYYPFVFALAVSGTNVFAGAYGEGLFLSTNNGISWTAVNPGLVLCKYINNLAVDDSNLYVGSNGSGVWFRPLSEMITTSVNGSPRVFSLEQNYPNPFNPTTVVRYQLPVASHVRLVVYDPMGREVALLANERREAGAHEVKFDGSNLASGVYFYRLQAGDFVQTKRLMLLK